MNELVITTGARLHFGLFARGQPGHREFGGIGVMIDQPGFVVRATTVQADEILCEEAWRPRTEELLAKVRSSSPSSHSAGYIRLEIVRVIPAHSGFGSGTQLGMAVAKTLSVLAGERDVAPVDLARRAGRGLRSAVGLHGFQLGGLIVEAGKRAPDQISPLVARVEFPARWRFVLVRPQGAAGISGTDESHSFARLAPMPQPTTDRLCRIALAEILPAAVEHDFARASDSISELGRIVGEYFAPVQGGVFGDERMRRLAGVLAARRISGVGQTSWGPTLFVLCPDEEFARRLVADLLIEPAAAGCDFTIAAPLNRGAIVQVQ